MLDNITVYNARKYLYNGCCLDYNCNIGRPIIFCGYCLLIGGEAIDVMSDVK